MFLNNFRSKELKNYYKKNFLKRIKYIRIFSYFYNYVSKLLGNFTDDSKNILFLGIGVYPFLKHLRVKNIFVSDISDKFFNLIKKNIPNKKFINFNLIDQKKNSQKFDKIILTSLENEENPISFLKNVRRLVSNDGRLFLLKNNLYLFPIMKFFELLGLRFKHVTRNIISENFLKNICEQTDFEVVHKEDTILFPLYIPIISNFINKFIAKFPILNKFCLISVYVLRPVLKKDKIDNYSLSIIVPCKNEEKNIKSVINSIPKICKKTQILFGDDKSTDNTLKEIKKFVVKKKNYEISYYLAPGISKSENVYLGFEKATGDIIAILDADNTVHGSELSEFIKLLTTKKYDFINGTRFVYPMHSKAMKKFNFFGNSLFSYLFSFLFNLQISDTLCGTKVFYKKDWFKIKKKIRTWGLTDLWGDYDLLLGAKYNFLKIGEQPVFYKNRLEGETKMKNILINGLRMFYIILFSFFYFKNRDK